MKQKPRQNRQARRRRDRKELRRLAATRLTEPILKNNGGKSPTYYTVVFHSIRVTVRNGMRRLRVQASVRPNEKYRDLIACLSRMCGDMTVDLSALRMEDTDHAQ